MRHPLFSLERLKNIPSGVQTISDPDAYLLSRASDSYNERHSKIWEEVVVEGGIGLHHMKLIYDVILRKGLNKGGKVLDVGCGTGPIVLELAGNVGPEGEVHGLDISTPQLDKAREKQKALGFNNVFFKEGTPTVGLPYEDNYFDLVVSHIAFQIMPHKEKTLREIFRVLEPGGMLALVTNSESTWSHVVNSPEVWCLVFDYVEKHPEVASKIHYPLGVFPTLAQMDRWLTDIGYVDIDLTEHNPLHRGLPMMNRAYWSIWIDDSVLDDIAIYARRMAQELMPVPSLMEPRLHVFAIKP